MANRTTKHVLNVNACQKNRFLSRSATFSSSPSCKLAKGMSASTTDIKAKYLRRTSINTDSIVTDSFKHETTEMPTSSKTLETNSKSSLKRIIPDCPSEMSPLSHVDNNLIPNIRQEISYPKLICTGPEIEFTKISGHCSSDEFRNCNAHQESQISRDIVQRLTNGGIAKVSLNSSRRHSVDTIDISEKLEPKSILKNAALFRRGSISYGEISRLSKLETPTSRINSCKSRLVCVDKSSREIFSNTGNASVDTTSADADHLPSEKEILKKCTYRLAPQNITSVELYAKKVTFKNDVMYIQNEVV